MTDTAHDQKTDFARRAGQFLLPMRLAAATLCVAIVSGLSIALWDHGIAFYVHDTLSRPAVLIWRDITKIGKSEIYIYISLALLIGGRTFMLWTAPHPIARWYRNLARLGSFGLACLVMSGAVIHTLKFIFGRIRPKDLVNHGESGFMFFSTEWSYNSFPSGHSQTMFVVAMILSYLMPRYRWAFLAVAAMIAFSRIAVQAHFLSDVIVGACIGMICVIFVKERWFADVDHLSYRPSAHQPSSPQARAGA